MSEKDQNQQTEERFQSFLAQLPAEQPVSDEIAIRLAHARASAIRQLKPRRSFGYWPAMAASVALAVTLGVLHWPAQNATPSSATVFVAELDVLIDDNERELIDELEFYQWLSAMEAG